MGNFSDYAEGAFYANQALIAEAQASGLTRAEVVAKAMALQPIALVYAEGADEWGNDHGLAMAWWCLQGHRFPLGTLAISANISGDWADVEACYGAERLADIKAWQAAMNAHKAEGRWSSLESPARLAFVRAADKIMDLLRR
jgi:hypothetical protein